MPDSPTIHECLIAVLGELDSIPKNGVAPASQGGYPFRRFEDVATALKPLFHAHGLAAPIARCLERIEAERKTSTGKTQYSVSLHIEWTISNAKGDKVVGSMWGEGTDMGDKATQKAVTASLKSFLTPAFLIADEGDDSEAHDTPETTQAPPKPLTPEQELAARKAAWGDKPLPAGWDTFEAMDERHAAFSAGVTSMPESERKQVAAFRAEQGIPWPMSVENMDEMLAEVKRIVGLRDSAQDAGQAAADGPMGQDIPPGE